MESQPPNPSDSLQNLLAYFDIKMDQWDALIVSDGSATTWDHEAGWGAVLIQKDAIVRKPFYGAMSCGTNNVAEIMGVMHPLMYLANNQKTLPPGGYKVHVITDSLYVANGLKNDNPVWASGLSKNRELWLAIQGVRRKGILITPHHLLRDTTELNRVAHDLANEVRRLILEHVKPDKDRILSASAG